MKTFNHASAHTAYLFQKVGCYFSQWNNHFVSISWQRNKFHFTTHAMTFLEDCGQSRDWLNPVRNAVE